MTTRRCIGSMLVSFLLLTACGSSGEPERPAPPPIEDTAFGEMAGALDKARSVEATTLEHKEAIDRAIDRSEGAGQ